MNWQSLFLSAKGRIGQKEYWIGFAILFVAGLVLGMIPVLGTIVSIALIYPWVCVYAKRLHDFGKSGWLAAIPFAIAALAGVFAALAGGAAMFGAASGDEAAAAGGLFAALAGVGVVLVLAFVAWLVFALWVGLSKGDPAPNRYGPPPADSLGATAATFE